MVRTKIVFVGVKTLFVKMLMVDRGLLCTFYASTDVFGRTVHFTFT